MQKKVVSGMSLFKNNTVEVTGVPRIKYTPTKEAVELYAKYHTELMGTHDVKDQSYINIDKLLKLGYTYHELVSAIDTYKKSLRNTPSDKRSKYIYACQNFFSPQQFKFTAYIPDLNLPDVPVTGEEVELENVDIVEEKF